MCSPTLVQAETIPENIPKNLIARAVYGSRAKELRFELRRKSTHPFIKSDILN